jgi:hypothetical protein
MFKKRNKNELPKWWCEISADDPSQAKLAYNIVVMRGVKSAQTKRLHNGNQS